MTPAKIIDLRSVNDIERQELERLAPRRLNVGCGPYARPYWTNLDMDTDIPAEIHCEVPPIPFDDGALDEVLAGHVLEHMAPEVGAEFLRECYRVLAPGGVCTVIVPDMREIMQRWLEGAIDHVEFPELHWWPIADLDAVCALFLYSTAQKSSHRWAYDLQTLGRAMAKAGFAELKEIDRYKDPRVVCGAWYQCGVEGRRTS